MQRGDRNVLPCAHHSAPADGDSAVLQRLTGGVLTVKGNRGPQSARRAFAAGSAGRRTEGGNRSPVTDADGHGHLVYGKGAGRWPMAAAMVAEVMDLQHRLAMGQPGEAESIRLTA